MKEARLFDPNKTEVRQQRIPERPLGLVSTYVVTAMPTDLAMVRQGQINGEIVAKKAELLLDATNKHIKGTNLSDPQKRDLATFDLTMLEAAIIHSGAIPPKKLVDMVDRFSTASGRPPIVTYEDLIFTNPLQSDPRTYTSGSVGRSELDFYIVHAQIEETMTIVNMHLKNVIHDLDQNGQIAVPRAQKILTQVASNFRETLKPMEQVGREMNKEHFDEFRIYFQPHPQRKLKGASGAFSAAIPTFDLLLGGENIEPEHTQYLTENAAYFPKGGYKEMQQAMQLTLQGLTLNALQKKLNYPGLTKKLHDLDTFLKQFRGKHLSAVARQTPEVYRGKQAGTAGEKEVLKFLKDRRNTQHIR